MGVRSPGFMMDNVGEDFREAFLEMLDVMGTACDAGGEQRKALKQTRKKEGYVVFQFADEFAIEAGDHIVEHATETRFEVVDTEAISKAGAFFCFEVTTERVA